MVAAVYVVAQEQVVVALDVSVVIRDSPEIEKTHQILVLSVNVTEYFDWRVDTQHHRLLLQHALTFLGECNNVFSTERKITVPVKLRRPLTWTQQVVQKQVVECFFLNVYLLELVFLLFSFFVHIHDHLDSFSGAWLCFNFSLVQPDSGLISC